MPPPWLQPFWRYYGGKWRAAPRYPAPRFDTLIEPFAGAAGYALRHYQRRVILIDRYDVIAEIWRFLIRARAEEIMRIPLVESVDDLPAGTPLGARHLVGFAMNAAAARPCRNLSSGRRKLRAAGRNFEGWSEAMRARVARQVGLIRHWQVVEGDCVDIAPDDEATWFIDPPYMLEGTYYKHGSTGIDYERLGRWCRAWRGQVIVCETVGATWLPFRPFGDFKSSPMSRKGGRSREAIWMSGETQQELLL
jgi:site-specific DNA-adenine methylase